jgi:TRAP-type mannitol/chloroaromatic compound transport system permease small subunit
VAISTLSQTRQQTIFLSIFFLIPAILLSVFIFPVEAMPEKNEKKRKKTGTDHVFTGFPML